MYMYTKTRASRPGGTLVPGVKKQVERQQQVESCRFRQGVGDSLEQAPLFTPNPPTKLIPANIR